jgi:hypothetical protein
MLLSNHRIHLHPDMTVKGHMETLIHYNIEILIKASIHLLVGLIMNSLSTRIYQTFTAEEAMMPIGTVVKKSSTQPFD